MIGAILYEASVESADGRGSWDKFTKKQQKCTWSEGEKPSRDEWLRALQMFQSAECLIVLEVQRELYENDVPSQAGNKLRRMSTSTVSRFTVYDTPPSSSVKVELVERSSSTTKVFLQYQIKNPQLWPKEDYFNAVIKKLDYRKKFKVDNNVLPYKKPKS